MNFSLITYNIHALPRLITLDDTYDRVKKIATLLEASQTDIIHIQEDWTDYGHAILTENLPNYNILRLDEKQNFTVFGSGLSSCSRLAIASNGSAASAMEIYTDKYGYDDMWANKGFIAKRFFFEEGAVDFYNTHMDAQQKTGDKDARRKNAEQLSAFINTWSKDYPVIVAGDTNLGSSTEDVDTFNFLLENSDLTDAAETNSNLLGRIDKILFKSSTDISLTVEYFDILEGFNNLSDHDPLNIILSMNRKHES